MRIIHTEYHVKVSCRKTTPAAAIRHSRQFTNRVEDSIGDAILQAAKAKVREHIKSGRLDKGFAVKTG